MICSLCNIKADPYTHTLDHMRTDALLLSQFYEKPTSYPILYLEDVTDE